MPPAALDPEGNAPEGHPFEDGSRLVRPESEKYTGQAPPEEIDDVAPRPSTTGGDKGGTG